MNKEYLITPSILSADFAHLGEEIKEVDKHGANWVHIDIIDGHFAPNLTMGFAIVKACRRVTEMPLDVHLMVEEPEKWIERFVEAGADRQTVHVETCPDLAGTLKYIKSLGCKAAVTLRPDTPAEKIKPVLDLVDHVLVMTVQPGYSGQKFMPETLATIRQVRQWLDEVNPQAPIQVDGGINPKTLPMVIDAGASVFVAASAIFGHPQGTAAGIESLWEVINAQPK
jgi:ribulose-phosphate 3-epimerase